MSRALAEAGAHVIVNGRDDEKLAAFERALRDEGFSVARAAFDIGDVAAVRAFFGGLKRLDILVNNAVAMEMKSFDALQASDFVRTYQKRGRQPLSEAARAALPGLRAAAAAAGRSQLRRQCWLRRMGRCRPTAGAFTITRESQSPLSLWASDSGATATDPPSRRRIPVPIGSNVNALRCRGPLPANEVIQVLSAASRSATSVEPAGGGKGDRWAAAVSGVSSNT